MAAVLSTSPWGPSRARGRGASLEKYSLCRRRVSLTEQRTSGSRARVSLTRGPEWRGSGASGKVCLLKWVRIPGCSQNSSENPSPSHTQTLPVFCHKHSCYMATPTPSTVASITPTDTILSPLLSLSQALGEPQLMCPALSLHTQARIWDRPQIRPSLLPLLQHSWALLGR